MADRGGRGRLVAVLLLAAALALVGGGLLVLTTDGGPAGIATEEVAVPAPAAVQVRAAKRHAGDSARLRGGGMRPDAVVVPALDVRADVTPIATQDGALTPPSDPLDVGWWSGGSRPGARVGATVLTGHTVHTGGGAFDDLEELAAGDRVLVLSGRRRAAYEVASVRVLSRARLARDSAAIFGRSGPGRLVLITCEDWDGAAYRSNVVVTARPASG